VAPFRSSGHNGMDGGNTHHDTGGGEAEEGLPRGGDSRHMDSWDSSRSLGTAVDRSIEGVRGDRAAGRDGRGGGGRRHCLPFRWGSSLLCSMSSNSNQGAGQALVTKALCCKENENHVGALLRIGRETRISTWDSVLNCTSSLLLVKYDLPEVVSQSQRKLKGRD
jgi:hypothetical protein